jgi:hypothetical protein
MNTFIRASMRKWIPVWSSIGLAVLLGVFLFLNAPVPASAHVDEPILSTCGKAEIDGQVNTSEWSSAVQRSFETVTAKPVPLSGTLYVMNTRNSLYIGITINDDEFTTSAPTVDRGDGFRIDFDNDHSGTLLALYDDALLVNAGLPQFDDLYVYNITHGSIQSDDLDGGSINGLGAAARVNSLNHFEVKHTLCSGDSHDFCLNPVSASTIGFRLEYLDAQSIDLFGGTYFYPDMSNTSEADIVIANCPLADYNVFLPMITR